MEAARHSRSQRVMLTSMSHCVCLSRPAKVRFESVYEMILVSSSKTHSHIWVAQARAYESLRKLGLTPEAHSLWNRKVCPQQSTRWLFGTRPRLHPSKARRSETTSLSYECRRTLTKCMRR